MAFIEWRASLSVGVAAMDQQHQQLIALINQLADAMTQGKSKVALGGILDELVHYTVYHFADEEKLLAQRHYPELSTHQSDHIQLTTQVADYQSQFRAGKLALSFDLMNFLRDWLANHIQISDKKYGVFLNQHGVF